MFPHERLWFDGRDQDQVSRRTDKDDEPVLVVAPMRDLECTRDSVLNLKAKEAGRRLHEVDRDPFPIGVDGFDVSAGPEW